MDVAELAMLLESIHMDVSEAEFRAAADFVSAQSQLGNDEVFASRYLITGKRCNQKGRNYNFMDYTSRHYLEIILHRGRAFLTTLVRKNGICSETS
jgi:hypothetical protein